MKKPVSAIVGILLIAGIAISIYRQMVQADLRRKDGRCVEAIRKTYRLGLFF